jgi:hypothetical protein
VFRKIIIGSEKPGTVTGERKNILRFAGPGNYGQAAFLV